MRCWPWFCLGGLLFGLLLWALEFVVVSAVVPVGVGCLIAVTSVDGLFFLVDCLLLLLEVEEEFEVGALVAGCRLLLLSLLLRVLHLQPRVGERDHLVGTAF